MYLTIKTDSAEVKIAYTLYHSMDFQWRDLILVVDTMVNKGIEFKATLDVNLFTFERTKGPNGMKVSYSQSGNFFGYLTRKSLDEPQIVVNGYEFTESFFRTLDLDKESRESLNLMEEFLNGKIGNEFSF